MLKIRWAAEAVLRQHGASVDAGFGFGAADCRGYLKGTRICVTITAGPTDNE
jgi:hypothetical protein